MEKVFKYYCYDCDDNLLFLSTKIHLDILIVDVWCPIDVSTKEFVNIRNDKNYRLRNNNLDETFSEFRDIGKRKDTTFLEDWIDAVINERFGPSWDSFIHCLTKGRLFSIITTRGHEPQNIRKVIEWTIDNFLTLSQKTDMKENLQYFNLIFDENPKNLIKNYLDNCMFCGVTSPTYQKILGDSSIEELKSKALTLFIERVYQISKKVGAKTIVGFSDDDPKFLERIEKTNSELSLKYLDLETHLFDSGL